MKNIFRYLGIVIVIFLIIFLSLYSNSSIGVYKANLEKDARVSQKIPTNWQVCKAETNSSAAMIFYDDKLEKYTFSIYINRKGFSFGYFYRIGGSGVIGDYVILFDIEGVNEKIYMSMNKQQVSKIEVNDGNNIEIINIDSTKPFTIIFPVNSGVLTMYDVNGNIVENEIYKL